MWEFVAIFEGVARWSVLKGDAMEPCWRGWVLYGAGRSGWSGSGLGMRILTIRLKA